MITQELNTNAMKSTVAKCLASTVILLVFQTRQPHIIASVDAAGIQQQSKQSVVVSLVEKDEVDQEFRQGRRQAPNSDVDANGKYVGMYNTECTNHLNITTSTKKVKIGIPSTILKEGKTTCHWNIVGIDDCVPSINCGKFQLSDTTNDPDEPCQNEYLEVTDGSYGYQKFCGQDGPKGLKSGKGLRDLYVTLKIGKEKITRSFSCYAECLSSDAKAINFEETTIAETDEHCNCGRKSNTGRIVGRVDAKKGEFPWMAALVATGTRKPYCGGSVINNKFILTAAHCFRGPYMKIKNFNVLLNAHELRLTNRPGEAFSKGLKVTLTPKQLLQEDEDDNTYRFKVDKYFIHPLYSKQTNDFDVALIKLNGEIDFVTMKQVSPVCLPKLDMPLESKAGVKCTVTGWGVNSSVSITMQSLQKVSVPVFSMEKCKNFYGDRVTGRMLCAGFEDGTQDSCKGDSGSPLISTQRSQVWEQIGIVSFGEDCAAKGKPGVYTDIPQVAQWIRYISNLEDATWCLGN